MEINNKISGPVLYQTRHTNLEIGVTLVKAELVNGNKEVIIRVVEDDVELIENWRSSGRYHCEQVGAFLPKIGLGIWALGIYKDQIICLEWDFAIISQCDEVFNYLEILRRQRFLHVCVVDRTGASQAIIEVLNPYRAAQHAIYHEISNISLDKLNLTALIKKVQDAVPFKKIQESLRAGAMQAGALKQTYFEPHLSSDQISMHLGSDDSYDPGDDDPLWKNRLSLFEEQMTDAVLYAFNLAKSQKRQTELLPQIITRAIADAVPVDEVPNRELAKILFGQSESENKRLVRHFRNEERPLRVKTAGLYIKQLIEAKKISPGDGGRLWYIVLLYSSARTVVANHFRKHGQTASLAFEIHEKDLLAASCTQFIDFLSASYFKNSKLAATSGSLHELIAFLDGCAWIYWRESRVKRHFSKTLERLINLTEQWNKFSPLSKESHHGLPAATRRTNGAP